MEGGRATEGLGTEKKGERGKTCTGASHDSGEVAAERCSGRGGAAWRAREKARGEGLGRRPAWGRLVGAARGRRWRRQSCNGGERWWPATAEMSRGRRRRGGRQGLMCKFQKFQGPRCKNSFSLFYIPNEKMVKTRIVEVFKTYNFYLGFKFKNSKDRALF
jgi:hypothetical protein